MTKRVRITEINVLVEVEKDGDSYHAFAPALKGLHVEGATKEQAFRNAEEAIDVYLDSMYRENERLPIGPYLSVKYEPIKKSIGSRFFQNVTVKCPTQRMFGTS
ncbi:MAG: type II toxin-antitoxin system HicB family antitoxin [Acidobacteria bacterium]|nr:type II toxin-antitoxin system HicB family antitoxin [Acidobacteriota bacterium]